MNDIDAVLVVVLLVGLGLWLIHKHEELEQAELANKRAQNDIDIAEAVQRAADARRAAWAAKAAERIDRQRITAMEEASIQRAADGLFEREQMGSMQSGGPENDAHAAAQRVLERICPPGRRV